MGLRLSDSSEPMELSVQQGLQYINTRLQKIVILKKERKKCSLHKCATGLDMVTSFHTANLLEYLKLHYTGTHTKRRATQHGCLYTQLTGRWANRTEIVNGEQGRTKISCTDTTTPTNQPRKNPFNLYSLSPHSLKFQQ